MRFAINLSILFTEFPLRDRFARAAEAGFTEVELWWPSDEDLGTVVAAAAAAGTRVVSLNLDAGEMAAGDRGLASDPDRRARFEENLPVALDLARALDCPRLNALIGLQIHGLEVSSQLDLARENIRLAADAAAKQEATILVEPLNTFDNGPYLLNRTDTALDFIDDVERPNVKLLYDVFHMQRMEGNLSATIAKNASRFGHVQIADSPMRGAPGTGEINFGHVLATLRDAGYRGTVGLEYRPRGATAEDLAWLPRAARAGDCEPEWIFGGGTTT
jgi:hydroxypyruvate isomerase